MRSHRRSEEEPGLLHFAVALYTKYRNQRRFLKVRCTCRSPYLVSLEFRQAYRRQTHLPGLYARFRDGDRGNMVVRNLSLTGITFTSHGGPGLQSGDRIRVQFTLDDPRSSRIEKKALVQGVGDHAARCEFERPNAYNGPLGFYLMS